MRNSRKAFLCFIALGLLLSCIATPVSAQNVEQIAEKALAATVFLEMKDRNGQPRGFGSGFFVGQNQIATNFHVIVGSARGTAKLVGKHTKYTIESIIATDEKNDLALLEVQMFGIQPLPLDDSNTVKIGQTVYVAGNPKGLEGTFSDGIISSLRKGYAKKLLQMTAPISPGSSGGPVLNGQGKVIGISVAGHRDPDAQNLNFAIPSNYLNALLQQTELSKPWPQKTARAEIFIRLGYRLQEQELYSEAIMAYDNAIQLEPDNRLAYFLRADTKISLEQYDAAVDDVDKAIQLEPDHFAAYVLRAIIKTRLKQYDAAIAAYDNVIRLKPDFARAYSQRGLLKFLLNLTSRAQQDFLTALKLAKQAGDEDLKTALKLAEQAGDEDLKADIEPLLQELDDIEALESLLQKFD